MLSTRAINSQTAIAQPRPLPRHSIPSIAPSQSQSNLSTPRHSSTRPVALNEHYTLPLILPSPWRSNERTWTDSQLERERSDFFDTRVTGRQEIWGALKTCTELLRDGELETAQGILEAAGVTLPTGNLVDGCYDEQGNLYRLPEVAILDPTNTVHEDRDLRRARDSGIDGATIIGVSESKSAALGGGKDKERDDGDDGDEIPEDKEAIERRRQEKGKAIIRDGVKIRCRLSDRGGPDCVVLLGREQSVGILARRVKEDSGVPSTSRIRIAYLGHMLDEKQPLAAQGWKEGHVLNALVAGSPPEFG